MKFGEFKYKRSEVRDSYQARMRQQRPSIIVSCGCIYSTTHVSIGIMSYCGSLSALAAGAVRVCLQFHALRFSRSRFHAAPQEKWESGSVREILLLFMYFDTQFARQFGAGNYYGESLRSQSEYECVSASECKWMIRLLSCRRQLHLHFQHSLS